MFKLSGLFFGVAVLTLTGCGSSDSDSGGTAPPETLSWTAGVFEPSDTFEQQCQAANEKFWLRSWSNETYLWYDEIIDRDPASVASVSEYFQLLKTEELTDSGAKKDNFHSSLPTAEWQAQSQSGVTFGYGFKIKLLSASAPRQAIVSFTEPNTQADQVGITRGFELLEVDGIDFINASTQAEVDMLNAGVYPKQTGKQTQFVFRDIHSDATFEYTLESKSIASQPVRKTALLNNDEVGYILFNSHNAVAEKQLYDAFTTFASHNISDLILDMRYNGGGFLQMASQVAYMIAGSNNTDGKIFEQTIFNDQHPTFNPITGDRLEPVLFTDEFVGFADNPPLNPGTPLPSLNLNRVFILTSNNTCSASEAVINGLRGADVEVIQIGTNTCGKPYGFYPTDNCDTTYFSIQFTGVNDKGFGEYADGFAPQNSNSSAFAPVMIPGCEVADDFSHALGDPAEAMLATALDYRTSGSCPAPANAIAKQGFAPSSVADTPAVHDSRAISIFNANRVLNNND